MKNKPQAKPYMNPYLAGFFLGFVLLVSIYVAGRGLGASGAVKSTIVQTVQTVAPAHAASSEYFVKQAKSHPEGAMKSWLVFEVLGVLIGAFFSAVAANRVRITVEKGPGVSNKTRIAMAILGGLLFGFGSQLGRGCTSGAALSGMAVMSAGGILTMMAIFGMAYSLAYFFRNLWIKKTN